MHTCAPLILRTQSFAPEMGEHQKQLWQYLKDKSHSGTFAGTDSITVELGVVALVDVST